MALILNIETATPTCSVALAKDGQLLSVREMHNVQSHASLVTLFIDEVLKESGKTTENLDAVAVSIGPGSYTGLRIGLSTAKGLTYALDIPLIEVNTLESLAEGMVSNCFDENGIYIPLIDARRDEVYYGVFNSGMDVLEKVQPLVLNCNSFSQYAQKAYVAGSGALKTIELAKEKQFIFLDKVNFSAINMLKKSNCYFAENRFSDIAYSEPEYLKPYYTNR